MAASPRKVKERRAPSTTTVGANVYRLRVLQLPKLSQEGLAARSGISVETIRLLEQSRDGDKPQLNPRLDTLDRLAQALDVEPYILLTPTPSKTTGQPRHLSLVGGTGDALPQRT